MKTELMGWYVSSHAKVCAHITSMHHACRNSCLGLCTFLTLIVIITTIVAAATTIIIIVTFINTSMMMMIMIKLLLLKARKLFESWKTLGGEGNDFFCFLIYF